MAGFPSVAADMIETSAAVIKRMRPAYSDILTFYAQIFAAQEEACRRIRLELDPIPASVVSVRIKQGLPLLDRSDFSIDPEVSQALLRTLCGIALRANETLMDAAAKLRQALDEQLVEPLPLFQAFLEDRTDCLEAAAGKMLIDRRLLMFFIYNSIKPSLTAAARQAAALFAPEDQRPEGRCPVCGEMPCVASLEDEGKRFLHCRFCWQRWHSRRLCCVSCANEEQSSLGYFYSETEPEYRVDTCKLCRHYIKTIDARKLNRPFCPALEQVCTLHLDLKAMEMGFQGLSMNAGEGYF